MQCDLQLPFASPDKLCNSRERTTTLTTPNNTNSKFNTSNWDECIMYAQMAWARDIKYVNISPFLTKVILKGFDQTCGAKGVLCCKDNLVIQ